MAKKDSLKKLTRKFPAPEELEDLLSTLGQGDDRTIAIVGASALEAILERFIQEKLEHCDSDISNQLFHNRGPLSDFHGKIIVAQACGFISAPMAKELMLVKSIRNTFAHTIVGISFNTEEALSKIRSSILLNAMRNENHPDEFRKATEGASGFALIVHILAILIDSDHQKNGGDPFMAQVNKLSTDS